MVIRQQASCCAPALLSPNRTPRQHGTAADGRSFFVNALGYRTGPFARQPREPGEYIGVRRTAHNFDSSSTVARIGHSKWSLVISSSEPWLNNRVVGSVLLARRKTSANLRSPVSFQSGEFSDLPEHSLDHRTGPAWRLSALESRSLIHVVNRREHGIEAT